MDDLTSEFLVETNESLDALDLDFIDLEKNPNDEAIIGNIFRVMHTIKGTCGFLGLSRLESVAHAAENILDQLRDKKFEVDSSIISLILEANDKIKEIIEYIEETESEPEGNDKELIDKLNYCAESGVVEGVDDSGAVVEKKVKKASSKKKKSDESDEVSKSDDEVLSEDSIKTPDLDGEIDFEPVMAPGAGDSDVSNDIKTPDLDGEIDFEPVMAPGAGDSDVSNDIKTPDLDGEIDFEPVMAPGAGDSSEEASDSSEDADDVEEEANEVQVFSLSEKLKEKAISKGIQESNAGVNTKKAVAGQSIRVGIDVLEELMQMVGELVLTRNQLLQMTRSGDSSGSSEFEAPLQRLNHITSDLQEGVMKTRMQPIGNAWAKFPRLVRDLSIDLDKKIELKMIGAETELDRQMLESIKDPLTHMVRNSADHGVESKDERAKTTKADQGTITLSAYHEGGHIIIKISDDGKGLDLNRIKAKAIENGVASAAEMESMSDKQIYQFIYKAGFSTAEAVTAVSGRGVGMDVVVSNIEKIGGTVEVDSTPGKGSVFTIQLPLTLAIMPVLIIQCGEEIFAIPQIRVLEIVRTDDDVNTSNDNEKSDINHKIETLNDSPVLRLRGKLLPLISLNNTLSMDREDPKKIESFVVVCEVGSQTIGVLVDKVFHTEEIVVKPTSPLMKDLVAYAGCTILGDGSVIMILDLNGIIKISGVNNLMEANSEEEEHKIENDDVVSFLVFKIWGDSPCAIPLELISRLEEIKYSDIEKSGGTSVVQYRGGLMRLSMIDKSKPIPENDSGTIEVIVFSDGDKVLGIVVEEILDIVRGKMEIKSSNDSDGILGSIVIRDKTTDLIDISHYFSTMFSNWFDTNGFEDSDDSAADKKHLLLIDDSMFFRKFMKPVLVVAGFDVSTAECAVDGYELLNNPEMEFDLVLTDIDMPDINGIEFTRQCKEDSRFVDIPFVALTSHTKEELLNKYDDPGFIEVVSKTDRDSLPTIISEILSVKNVDAA